MPVGWIHPVRSAPLNADVKRQRVLPKLQKPAQLPRLAAILVLA